MTLRLKVRVTLGLLMVMGGAAGAVLSGLGRIAKEEPKTVLQLSWAAIWLAGVTSLISIDDG